MLHRIKKRDDMHAGKWNGLGGKLEAGESPEECAVREVREESGLQVVNPELRGILTFPSFSKNEDWYAFVFVCRSFIGELLESSEGVLKWVEDQCLHELNLWEGDRIFLPWLDRAAFFSARFVYAAGMLESYEAHFYPCERDSRGTTPLTTLTRALRVDSGVEHRHPPVTRSGSRSNPEMKPGDG